MSKLEGSKTSFTAFTVYVLYYFLIFKNIFSLDLVQGSESPRDFFWVLIFTPIRSSPSLKSRVPPLRWEFAIM